MNDNSINQKQQIKVKFDLSGIQIPENKVYATISIEPESAGKHLKHFELIINNEEHKFGISCDYHNISIYGEQSSPCQVVYSNSQTIFIDEHIYNVLPIIQWKIEEKSILIVKWNHIGDNKAQEYLLYLDNKIIVHIPQREIHEELTVNIENVSPKEGHLVEVVARLFNGKETYRSGPYQTRLSNKVLQSGQCYTVFNISAEEKPEKQLILPPQYKNNESNKSRFEELLEKLKQDIEQRRRRIKKLYENNDVISPK